MVKITRMAFSADEYADLGAFARAAALELDADPAEIEAAERRCARSGRSDDARRMMRRLARLARKQPPALRVGMVGLLVADDLPAAVEALADEFPLYERDIYQFLAACERFAVTDLSRTRAHLLLTALVGDISVSHDELAETVVAHDAPPSELVRREPLCANAPPALPSRQGLALALQ